ncbi:MAG: hypothetical protein ACN4E2_03620 [Nitrospinota bacterium]
MDQNQTRYFIFTDQIEYLLTVIRTVEKDDNFEIIFFGRDISSDLSNQLLRLNVTIQDNLNLNTIVGLGIHSGDRVIISSNKIEQFSSLIKLLSSNVNKPDILLVTEQLSLKEKYNQAIDEHMEEKFELISIRAKVLRLQKLFANGKKVAILIQNDVDPDALASAMGLCIILGRNKDTIDIVTFGGVTRNENIMMRNLLDIDLKVIKDSELANYDKIGLVDVQPPYFTDHQLP